MTLPAWLADDPLYKELGKIGRVQKSLAPGGLLSYKELLSCAEVNRRVSAQATPLQRAEAAAEAIIEAVAGIDNEAEQIAEAVLCIRGSYIGKSVKDRKRALRGISAESFKQKRPEALAHVVAFLSAPVRHNPIPLPPRPPELEQGDYLGYNVRCVSRDAFALHCSGLASLFVCEFDAVLREHGIEQSGHMHSEACAEQMFRDFSTFVSSSHYSFVDHLASFREWAAKRSIEPETAEWLALSVQQTTAYCPLASTDASDTTVFQLMGGPSGNGVHVRDLYSLVWEPWYFADWPFHPKVPSGVERITVQSGAIASVLTGYLGTNQPVDQEARDEAVDTVGRYYGYRDGELTVDGKSLVEHTRAYFKVRGGELVNRVLP